ncbi:9021_t:CDS:2, partial [Gigaspora margarita]
QQTLVSDVGSGLFGILKSGLVSFVVKVVVDGIVVVSVGNVLVVVVYGKFVIVVVSVLSSLFGNEIGVGLFFIFKNAINNKE